MKTRLDIVTLLTFVMALGQSGSVQANDRDQGQIVDLSLIVAENYPCTWATGFPRFYMNRYILLVFCHDCIGGVGMIFKLRLLVHLLWGTTS